MSLGRSSVVINEFSWLENGGEPGWDNEDLACGLYGRSWPNPPTELKTKEAVATR